MGSGERSEMLVDRIDLAIDCATGDGRLAAAVSSATGDESLDVAIKSERDGRSA
jgi:hypothetical protein